MTEISVVGVSHRSVPLEFLEKLAYRPDQIGESLRRIIHLRGVREAVLLSTCNRTEIYTAADEGVGAEVSLYLARDRGVSRSELDSHLVAKREGDVARHIFRVAAGLDSMIIGESDIQGQVRSARAAAHEADSIGPSLDELFTWAIRTSRRVRRETTLGSARHSIGHVAVDLAASVVGGLQGRRAIVLGTGKVAVSVVRMLDHAGAERMVCGRARERAQRLVAPEGSVIGVEDLERHLISADVLFCCTSADALLVTRSMLEQGPDRRNALIVVDLSLPHNVDREVAKLPKVRLLTLADIGLHHAQPGRELVEAAHTAESIVDDAVARFLRRRKHADLRISA